MSHLPETIPPMLATISEPFDSPDYIYEIKWDGYRCLSFINGSTWLQSRNLKDISRVFPELTSLHRLLDKSGIILDGEIIALRQGKPSFLQLQKRALLKNESEIHRLAGMIPVVYIIFDILYFQYQPVFRQPFHQRRALLERLIPPDSPSFILTETIPNQGIKYFQAVSQLGMEGVIAKKNNSVYLPGKRSKSWLKFKRKLRHNFIVCGYELNETSRGQLKSILVGAFLGKKLTPFGMVGSGFSGAELESTLRNLEQITTDINPFTGTICKVPRILWTKPILVCDVEYTEITDDGSLRHPVFKGFQPKKTPPECIFEDEYAYNH